jgi:hypothetical protein
MKQEELFKKFENDMQKRPRFLRFLLALDQLFNVLLWNGSQDETISSHIHRRQELGRANRFDNVVCKFLRLIESKHCLKSKGE